MPSSQTTFGLQAEEFVSRHLRNIGYAVLDRNFRRPWGELDIVAELRGVVHFVEVKASRRQVTGFDPFVRADGWKMQKVKRTARTWLAFKRYGSETEWQMDIASVIMDPTLGEPHIELFENV
jgi:putative endonuclease